MDHYEDFIVVFLEQLLKGIFFTLHKVLIT